MGAEVETIRIEGSLLADLYARHADGALRLSYLLTGDGALAEDLVQDAFVRVAGRLLHLRDPGGFHAYLRKTIVNLARSHYRRRAVERRYLERQTEAPRTSSFDVFSTSVTCSAVPERQIVKLRPGKSRGHACQIDGPLVLRGETRDSR